MSTTTKVSKKSYKDLGIKLYSSRTLWPFKIFYLTLNILLFFQLLYSHHVSVHYFEVPTLMERFEFHLKYPEELITYLILIFFPAIYYSFFRAIVFFENGVKLNRGLPFFNRYYHYSDFKSYKIVHPKYLVALKRADGEEFLFTTQNIDRVISILDQNQLSGDLSKANFKVGKFVNLQIIILFTLVSVIVFLMQFFGLFPRMT